MPRDAAKFVYVTRTASAIVALTPTCCHYNRLNKRTVLLLLIQKKRLLTPYGLWCRVALFAGTFKLLLACSINNIRNGKQKSSKNPIFYKTGTKKGVVNIETLLPGSTSVLPRERQKDKEKRKRETERVTEKARKRKTKEMIEYKMERERMVVNQGGRERKTAFSRPNKKPYVARVFIQHSHFSVWENIFFTFPLLEYRNYTNYIIRRCTCEMCPMIGLFETSSDYKKEESEENTLITTTWSIAQTTNELPMPIACVIFFTQESITTHFR